MDGESSCESDVSESWSIIDLNLNEQLPEAASTNHLISSEATPNEIIKNENDCKNEKKIITEKFELMEFSKDLNQVDNSQTILSSTVDSPKNESSTKSLQDFIILDNGQGMNELVRENNDYHENLKFNFNDTDVLECENKSRETDFDTDGISVISEAECDETKYYSNENDKNWEEELQTEYLSNAFKRTSQTVIKKRRKRIKFYNDSSDDNLDYLNSDLVSTEANYSYSYSPSTEGSNDDEMQVSANPKKPVYRHYRNNVANTVLSLAMGVIFAGVACIALGHFLGVHDAEQTAGEMMEALKRLQMENVQLQSRLSHLSRVFFTRDIHQTKPDFTQSNVVMQNCINSDLNQQIYKTEDMKKDNNGKLNSSVENNFISLPKLENFIKKRDLVRNNVGMKIENILKQIHEHMTFLSDISKDDPKLKRFQELDSKIAKFVDKLAQSTPKTDVGVQKLLKRLCKFSEKLEYKLCKHFFNMTTQQIKLNCEMKKEISQKQAQNLNFVQWYPVKEENQCSIIKINSLTSSDNPSTTYNLPQPEKYYQNLETNLMTQKGALYTDIKINEDNDVIIEEEPESNMDGGRLQKEEIRSSISSPLPPEKVTSVDTSDVVRMGLDQSRIYDNFRINKSNGKEYKEKRKEKKRKEEKRKQFDKSGGYKNNRREKYKFDETKKLKYSNENFRKEKLNKKILKERLKNEKHNNRRDGKRETKPSDGKRETKPSDEKKNKAYKNAQKGKYGKKDTSKKFFKKSDSYPEAKSKSNGYKLKENVMNIKNDAKLYAQIRLGKNHKCGSNCYNTSGDWVYKMAEGREQCRRYRRLSDWQFDRAKSREALRDVSDNWFIGRAAARNHDRDDAKWFFKRFDARNHRRRGFSPETFSWI